MCMYPGVVTRSEFGGAYGHKVVVKHNRNGHDFYTWYCHLDARFVSPGQQVSTGTWLGEIGDTGNTTGEHVHINLQVPGFGLSGYVVADVVNPDPYILRVGSGNPMLGLHASADTGDLTEAEFREFRDTKPGVIKVLSAHSGTAIARLCIENMAANDVIIRAFLDFGGRVVSPQDFFNWTRDDILRAAQSIPANRTIWLEIHNEPNLAPEGLFSSWGDGSTFSTWLNAVASLLGGLQVNLRLVYPGLSPGGSIPGFRQDHVSFIEQSRSAVNTCDALGVHIYWSPTYSMSTALAVLDDYIARFPGKPIWITESSNNKPGPTPSTKAQQYIQFWQALRSRPIVRGVTYFVASASNPAFNWPGGSCETWVGQGIGAIVGSR